MNYDEIMVVFNESLKYVFYLSAEKNVLAVWKNLKYLEIGSFRNEPRIYTLYLLIENAREYIE